MQFNSWEQGYKNYIDKKYKLYDHSDKEFYDIITTPKSDVAELYRQRTALSTKRLETANRAYVEQFTKSL